MNRLTDLILKKATVTLNGEEVEVLKKLLKHARNDKSLTDYEWAIAFVLSKTMDRIELKEE